MTPDKSSDWRPIAEQASKEKNPAKMMVLIAQLCQVFDGERAKKASAAATQENQATLVSA
jgi:hypothetical protein